MMTYDDVMRVKNATISSLPFLIITRSVLCLSLNNSVYLNEGRESI